MKKTKLIAKVKFSNIRKFLLNCLMCLPGIAILVAASVVVIAIAYFTVSFLIDLLIGIGSPPIFAILAGILAPITICTVGTILLLDAFGERLCPSGIANYILEPLFEVWIIASVAVGSSIAVVNTKIVSRFCKAFEAALNSMQ